MVQQDNFLTYIKNSKYAYYYPLFVFMLETALRVGEVCGLTWDDVDLEHGFVNITHQLQYNNVGKMLVNIKYLLLNLNLVFVMFHYQMPQGMLLWNR